MAGLTFKHGVFFGVSCLALGVEGRGLRPDGGLDFPELALVKGEVFFLPLAVEQFRRDEAIDLHFLI